VYINTETPSPTVASSDANEEHDAAALGAWGMRHHPGGSGHAQGLLFAGAQHVCKCNEDMSMQLYIGMDR